MHKELIRQYYTFLRNQNRMEKRFGQGKVDDYSASELGVITVIGSMTDVNVTILAQHLQMTKGAISKIIRKLTDNHLIENYQKLDNHQKIYYHLTDSGKDVFDRHWVCRDGLDNLDREFLSKFSEDECEIICKFFTQFNAYLENKLL